MVCRFVSGARSGLMKSSSAIPREGFGSNDANRGWRFIQSRMKSIEFMKMTCVFSTKDSTKVATKVWTAMVLVGSALSGLAQSDLLLSALTKADSESSKQATTIVDAEETEKSSRTDAWFGVSTSETSETLGSQ